MVVYSRIIIYYHNQEVDIDAINLPFQISPVLFILCVGVLSSIQLYQWRMSTTVQRWDIHHLKDPLCCPLCRHIPFLPASPPQPHP